MYMYISVACLYLIYTFTCCSRPEYRSKTYIYTSGDVQQVARASAGVVEFTAKTCRY